jgi:serine protease Do
VILSVDGKRVDYVGQLQEQIAFRRAGDVVSLEVARKGGARTTIRVPVQATSEDAPAADRGTSSPERRDDRASVPSLGISAAPLDDVTARRLGVPADARGVVVTEVDDGSPAASRLADPQSGGPDIITAVEGKAVRTPGELRDALSAQHNGDVVTLSVYNAPSKTRRIERVRLGAAE